MSLLNRIFSKKVAVVAESVSFDNTRGIGFMPLRNTLPLMRELDLLNTMPINRLIGTSKQSECDPDVRDADVKVVPPKPTTQADADLAVENAGSASVPDSAKEAGSEQIPGRSSNLRKVRNKRPNRVAGTAHESLDLSLVLKPLSDVATKEQGWLCPEVIPSGAVTLFAGQPGTNKSFLIADIAAKVSTGGMLGGFKCEQGEVLLFCGEDPESRVKERLVSADADISRIHLAGEMTEDGSESSFQLVEHFDVLEQTVIEHPGIKMIVFDTLPIFVGTASMSAATQVAVALQKIAERYDIAIVCITHLTKTLGSSAVTSVKDNGAFTSVARHAWLVSKDTENTDRRLLSIIKTNITKEPLTMAFVVEGKRLRWEADRFAITSDEVLMEAKEAQRNFRTREKADPKQDFLFNLLSQGPKSYREIEAEGKERGYSMHQLRRTLRKLGGHTEKSTSQYGSWIWSLPWVDPVSGSDSNSAAQSNEAVEG